MASIHDKVRDGLSLAKIYADDGAFRTAAARLRTLADELEAHGILSGATAREVHEAGGVEAFLRLHWPKK